MGCRADRAHDPGLNDDHELAFGIAAVDLRSRKRFDCARDRIKFFWPRLNENAGDFDGMRSTAVRHPATVDKLAAIHVAGERCFEHGTPHFDGGPGRPLIAW